MPEDKLVIRSMSRSELADAYNVSDKTLRQRLRRAGVSFEGDRVLLPIQIKQIIEALGPWSITLDES